MGQKAIRNLLVVGLVLIGAIIVGFAGYQGYMGLTRGKITTEIEPYDATVKIDGKLIKVNKKIYVTPGQHTITAHRADFTDQSQQFTSTKGKATKITIYLNAANDNGLQWIKDHPDVQQMYEGHSSAQYDAQTQKNNEAEPFVQLLPYIAPGFEFRIDYGSPDAGQSKPVIYVQADTQQAKDDALEWIRNQGYDPSTLNIQYTTSSSVEQEQSGFND